MLSKERSVGMYKVSAYLVARNASDLPLDLLLPVVFLAIIYFMVGLKHTFAAFSLTLLSMFLSIIAAQGLGLSIGATFMDVKKATTLASVTVMTFMLSDDFFITEKVLARVEELRAKEKRTGLQCELSRAFWEGEEKETCPRVVQTMSLYLN